MMNDKILKILLSLMKNTKKMITLLKRKLLFLNNLILTNLLENMPTEKDFEQISPMLRKKKNEMNMKRN